MIDSIYLIAKLQKADLHIGVLFGERKSSLI